MYKLTTLGEAYNAVQKESEGYHDLRPDVRGIRFRNVETLDVEGVSHRLSGRAMQQVGQRLDVPMKYLEESLPRDIQAGILNYRLGEYYRSLQTEKDETTVLLRMNGSRVRAFLSSRYNPRMTNLRAVSILLEKRFSPDMPVRLTLGDDLMEVDLLDREHGFTIKGDDMYPGIGIINSETGWRSLETAMFWYRVVCTNGLIARESTRHEKHYHTFGNLERMLSSMIDRTLTRAREKGMFSELAALTRRTVGQPQEIIEDINTQYKLDRKSRDAVDWAARQEDAGTVFGISQVYAKAAQYAPLDEMQVNRLQVVGGELAFGNYFNQRKEVS